MGSTAKGSNSKVSETGRLNFVFLAFDAVRHFHDYDGVIFFQGSFERFTIASNGFDSYLRHEYDQDQLGRRTNEALLLSGKGGFLGMLLDADFIDSDSDHRTHRDFSMTDLSKRLLNGLGILKVSLRARHPLLDCKVEELRKFKNKFGAAWTGSRPKDSNVKVKTLATLGSHNVSVLVERNIFVITTLPH